LDGGDLRLLAVAAPRVGSSWMKMPKTLAWSVLELANGLGVERQLLRGFLLYGFSPGWLCFDTPTRFART
jgi:hypothetical protein